jgi:hypothetical protein
VHDSPAPLDEQDLLRIERISDAAMVSASASIAHTVDELALSADAARRARTAADRHEAEAIAACVAETAAAFDLGTAAVALRAEWVASRKAKEAAGRVPSGDEELAVAAATRTAGRIARLTEERAAFDRREAKRACAAAIADIDRVDAAVDRTAAATELTSYAQGLALGRIAVDTAVQVAINEG